MAPPSTFALVDGNNFYASCERVFEPRLRGQPLVVLSNNDGCAIARSDEAKALGVAMGAPWFRIRHLEQQAGLVALSANFALYGDMSQRLMEVAAELGHGQEIYSIDECFIDLTGLPEASARARQTRERIQRWLGLPTCIGLEQAPAPKQQIAVTRSFGQPVTELDDLRQALATLAAAPPASCASKAAAPAR